ncbi:MAG: GMC family oxidoreductase N-terminal domain-containing protein [Nakamurella sp.]
MRPLGFDYIIVGSGSAGCVLAARLSADPNVTVLLLEAGGTARRVESVVPALYPRLFRSSVDWAYRTEVQDRLNGRRLFWPRGRMVGGSSRMNDMVYIRGNRADYDRWHTLGNDGWDYRSVLPYFRRSENQQRGPSEFHGVGGPLDVSDLRYVHPRTLDFLAAAGATGLDRNDDFNGAEQVGVGLHQVNQLAGRRSSAASGFLRPALGRTNLTVVTGAHAGRVLFAANRAVGVQWMRHGRLETATADAEVVLSGGSVNTPALLMLSGVGDATALAAIGIRPRVDLPGVGRNLQDHLMVPVSWRSAEQSSLLDGKSARSVLSYATRRTGPLASNLGQAGAFTSTGPEAAAPDTQLVFAPVLLDDVRDDRVVEPTEHGYSIGSVLLQPASRGEVTLSSANPADRPVVRPGYLTEPGDLETLVRGVRLALAIGGSQPLAGAARDRHALAGASRGELEQFIRANVDTMFHPVGTCAMGTGDDAVVDPDLRVKGLDGLRVVDASVMPTVTRGNTHAPTTMIAERAADLLLAAQRAERQVRTAGVPG